MWDRLKDEYGGYTGWVWLAIIAGLLVRLLSAKHNTWWTALKESLVGLLCAYLFTNPVMAVGALPADAKIGVAALLAIWGGKVLVLVLEAPNLADLIRAWRGK